MSLPATHPTPQRLNRGPFIAAVAAVYVVSFISQMLLSSPVVAALSVVPFVIVQLALIVAWMLLHRRRLRDAGRPTGIVTGIAMVYALEIVLLVILVVFLTTAAGSSASTGSGNPVLNLFLIAALLTSFSGDQGIGALQFWMVGFALLMLLPLLVSIAFSLWAAALPSQGSAA